MLALDDLVDLGVTLRGAGYKVSPEQILSLQQLLLRLAAQGGLPERRAPLARWFAPLLCTNAGEQRGFDAVFAAWLRERFPDDEVPEPPEPPPPPPLRHRESPAWRRAGIALLLLGAALFAWDTWQGRLRHDGGLDAPEAAASAASAAGSAASGGAAPVPAGGSLESLGQFDFSAQLPPLTLAQRLHPGALALGLAPWLLYLVWLVVWLRRKPVLQRLASRTPQRLRDVHVPGAARALLPSLPLRRLAQELRRRRLVDSSELLVEPTVLATLRRGGLFTPVRGARAEPDYLVLVDRAGLADHQARLAGEIVAELARSDVLVERFDFDRDARLCRPRDPLGRAAATLTGVVELAELHERHPDHRVLVFGDGAGCFDGYTGEPLAWTLTLAQWSLAVLLTPLPRDRWGRREWALQRLGIQVLPLSPPGIAVLMGLAAGLAAPPVPSEAPERAAPRSFERTPRRWLERDRPDDATVEALCADLRAELGPRGWAWLAASAAYPEVHWGITLRLGAALVPDAAEFERVLPRIARLIWFREAYLPDWLRERLLAGLDADDEARAVETLRALLENVAKGGSDEIPLHIALGGPSAGMPWWRRLWERLRAGSARQRARNLLRSAPPDSPLRDHVFLRFLSGQSVQRTDFGAPGGLAGRLRSRRVARPLQVVGFTAFVSFALMLAFQPVSSDLRYLVSDRLAFGADSRSVTLAIQQPMLNARSISLEWPRSVRVTARAADTAAAWQVEPVPAPVRWQVLSPDGSVALVRRADRLAFEAVTASRLPDRVLTGDDPIAPRFAVFSGDGSHLAMLTPSGLTWWDVKAGRQMNAARVATPTAIASMIVSNSGDYVALRGHGGTPLLWSTGPVELLELPNAGVVQDIAFGSGAAPILVTSSSTAITLWDTRTRSVIRRVATPEREWQRAGVSPDGKWIAAWTSRGTPASITIFDAASGMGARTLPIDAASGSLAVAFSPDGRYLAAADDSGRVRAWQTASLQPVGDVVQLVVPAGFQGNDVRLGFTPDSSALAVSVGAGLGVWHLPTGAAAAAIAGTSYALVVGNDYRGSRSSALRTPVRDAREIAAVLSRRFGFRTTLLADPSRDELLAGVDAITKVAKPQDQLLVFLAGHGLQRDGSRQFAYIATPPGRELNVATDEVRGDEIVRRLASSPMQDILVLGDTQFVDLLRNEKADARGAAAGRSRLLIASYGTGQMAMEGSDGSSFALALSAVLRGAGPGLTASALFAELTQRMPAMKGANGQKPTFYRLNGAGDNGGEFSFPVPNIAAEAQPPVPAASAASAVAPLAGINVKVTVCTPTEASTAAILKRLLGALGRLGVASPKIENVAYAEFAKQQRSGAFQVRVPTGTPGNAQAAQRLLSDAGFRGTQAWSTVSQPGAGPLDVVLCPAPRVAARAPATSSAATVTPAPAASQAGVVAAPPTAANEPAVDTPRQSTEIAGGKGSSSAASGTAQTRPASKAPSTSVRPSVNPPPPSGLTVQ